MYSLIVIGNNDPVVSLDFLTTTWPLSVTAISDKAWFFSATLYALSNYSLLNFAVFN
jgi:hypothetical protein